MFYLLRLTAFFQFEWGIISIVTKILWCPPKDYFGLLQLHSCHILQICLKGFVKSKFHISVRFCVSNRIHLKTLCKDSFRCEFKCNEPFTSTASLLPAENFHFNLFVTYNKFNCKKIFHFLRLSGYTNITTFVIYEFSVVHMLIQRKVHVQSLATSSSLYSL